VVICDSSDAAFSVEFGFTSIGLTLLLLFVVVVVVLADVDVLV
jgi:hypothetical protein